MVQAVVRGSHVPLRIALRYVLTVPGFAMRRICKNDCLLIYKSPDEGLRIINV